MKKTLPKNAEKVLFSFKKPSEAVLNKIYRTLAELEIVPRITDRIQSLQKEDATLIGNLDDVISALEKNLDLDYKKNSKESKSQGWHFEYVVRESGLRKRVVDISTRLYHPDQKGNIFYGRNVQRIGEAKYIGWIDD